MLILLTCTYVYMYICIYVGLRGYVYLPFARAVFGACGSLWGPAKRLEGLDLPPAPLPSPPDNAPVAKGTTCHGPFTFLHTRVMPAESMLSCVRKCIELLRSLHPLTVRSRGVKAVGHGQPFCPHSHLLFTEGFDANFV